MTECYMCPAQAISTEHVPPKCIFPESKDLPSGGNYRKNLITVPSCKEHNSTKSKDDEYLLFILATNWNVNDIGLQHWLTKVIRALETNPSKMGIYKDLSPITINGVPTGKFHPDIDRFSEEVIKISRGIYYHHVKKQWLDTTSVICPSLIDIREKVGNINNIIIQKTSSMIQEFLANEPVLGENPDIFYYQYRVDDDSHYYCLRMVFFGGIEVSTISPDVEPAKPNPT